MDFRKADPTYVNFVPTTCAEAIDLFCRHKNLGLPTNLYPECFIHCARKLPGEELDNFHRYIVAPRGDVGHGGEKETIIDVELEKERVLLLKEAEERDMPKIVEEDPEPSLALDQEDEKSPESEDESLLIIEKCE